MNLSDLDGLRFLLDLDFTWIVHHAGVALAFLGRRMYIFQCAWPSLVRRRRCRRRSSWFVVVVVVRRRCFAAVGLMLSVTMSHARKFCVAKITHRRDESSFKIRGRPKQTYNAMRCKQFMPPPFPLRLLSFFSLICAARRRSNGTG